MKHFIVLMMLGLSSMNAYSQKRIIDVNAFDKWPEVIEPKLTNNGQYVSFIERNISSGSQTLVIKNVDNDWEMRTLDLTPGSSHFSSDSKSAFWLSHDTLLLLSLKTKQIKKVIVSGGYKLPWGICDLTWIAYFSDKDSRQLTVLNITSGKKMLFPNVDDYHFNPSGQSLVIKKVVKTGTQFNSKLFWIALNDGTLSEFLNLYSLKEAVHLSNLCFDKSGSRIAFKVDGDSTDKPHFYYYRTILKKAKIITSKTASASGTVYEISGIRDFSKDCEHLFLNFKPLLKPTKTFKKSSNDNVKVNIWSYTETRPPSHAAADSELQNELFGELHLRSAKLHLIQRESEEIQDVENGHYAIFRNSHKVLDQSDSVRIVSFKDLSSRKNKEVENISPDGKYLLYFDASGKSYLSMNFFTGSVNNIIEGLKTQWPQNDDGSRDGSETSIAFAAWTRDEGVLVYDQYDIWKLDLAGRCSPKNITNFYGKKNSIVLRLALEEYKTREIKENEQLIITGFNILTKDNGFFQTTLSVNRDPRRLIMDQAVYSIPDGIHFPIFFPRYPVVALNSQAYILPRQSTTSFPNFLFTRDFKSFKPISDLHPEENYNWMTSELITWKSAEGKLAQGILYKPRDFDAGKSYPLIYLVYEQRSNELNYFHIPGPSTGEINIAWFVSRGYLVFTPDIHLTTGHIGQGFYDAVMSSSRVLFSRPYINQKAIGLSGHSFGGFGANYLISHCNLFAAACSASGGTDQISYYNAVSNSGDFDFQSFSESGQLRMGKNLWDGLSSYLENSPVLKADKITTPVLLMANKEDGIVPYSQGMELFLSLRRLKKKAWLLEYEGFGHQLYDEAAKDYTTRVEQFFDHYLKGKPAPSWMANETSAEIKKGEVE